MIRNKNGNLRDLQPLWVHFPDWHLPKTFLQDVAGGGCWLWGPVLDSHNLTRTSIWTLRPIHTGDQLEFIPEWTNCHRSTQWQFVCSIRDEYQVMANACEQAFSHTWRSVSNVTLVVTGFTVTTQEILFLHEHLLAYFLGTSRKSRKTDCNSSRFAKNSVFWQPVWFDPCRSFAWAKAGVCCSSPGTYLLLLWLHHPELGLFASLETPKKWLEEETTGKRRHKGTRVCSCLNTEERCRIFVHDSCFSDEEMKKNKQGNYCQEIKWFFVPKGELYDFVECGKIWPVQHDAMKFTRQETTPAQLLFWTETDSVSGSRRGGNKTTPCSSSNPLKTQLKWKFSVDVLVFIRAARFLCSTWNFTRKHA